MVCQFTADSLVRSACRDEHAIRIASILGIAQTVYSRYERGYQTIPLEHLVKLADFYGVSIDYLVGRTCDKRLHE